jgi:hypothetical protein
MIEGSCHCGTVRWQLHAVPESATACNCSACRRYGVIWAYDHEDEGIRVAGPTRSYKRYGGTLGFHFCPRCGCVAYWRATAADDRGRRRIAVNLRLAEPGEVASVLIDRFDGLESWEDLPRDGRCVADVWF